MNVTELRDALDDFAGPLVAPTAAQRQSVRIRVRRARLLRATSVGALLLVVAVGAGAMVRSGPDADRPTRVVTDRSTTVHDDTFGFTVTMPPDWARDLPDAARGTPVMILNITSDAKRRADTTRQQFADLTPIYAERTQLQQQLDNLPLDSPERARIEGRIDALNDAEVEIRSRTNDLRPIEVARQQLQEQLKALSPDAPERAEIESQIDALNNAEVRIRSRRNDDCAASFQPFDVRIIVQEGDGPAVARPARFGTDSGSGLASDPASPGCTRLAQSMHFADAGREFYFAITMAPDTPPAASRGLRDSQQPALRPGHDRSHRRGDRHDQHQRGLDDHHPNRCRERRAMTRGPGAV